MACVIAAELHIRRPLAERCRVNLHPRGRIIFIPLARQMKDRRAGLLVGLAGLPVTGNAAGDADDAPEDIWMRKRKPIIQRTRLRETEEENAVTVRGSFIDQ